MKWWIAMLLAAVLTVIFGLPFREYETGQLLPIKTLQAETTPNGVHIVSEVAQGEGETWLAAVADLRKNAAGDVFFDTAEQIVLTDLDLAYAAAQSGLLRPSAQVYIVAQLTEPEGLNAYLSAHPSDLQIKDFS